MLLNMSIVEPKLYQLKTSQTRPVKPHVLGRAVSKSDKLTILKIRQHEGSLTIAFVSNNGN